MPLSKPTDFDSGSGIGVRGTVEGKRLALGNTALMEQEGVSVAALQADGERLRGEGASIMHLAVDGHFAGILAVTDFGSTIRLKRAGCTHKNNSSHLTVTITDGYRFLRSFNCLEGTGLQIEWQPTWPTLPGNSASLVFFAVVHIRPAHDQKRRPQGHAFEEVAPGACFV